MRDGLKFKIPLKFTNSRQDLPKIQNSCLNNNACVRLAWVNEKTIPADIVTTKAVISIITVIILLIQMIDMTSMIVIEP